MRSAKSLASSDEGTEPRNMRSRIIVTSSLNKGSESLLKKRLKSVATSLCVTILGGERAANFSMARRRGMPLAISSSSLAVMIIPGDILKIPSWVLCGLIKVMQSLTKAGVLGLNELSLTVNADRARGFDVVDDEEEEEEEEEEGEQRTEPEDERKVCLEEGSSCCSLETIVEIDSPKMNFLFGGAKANATFCPLPEGEEEEDDERGSDDEEEEEEEEEGGGS